MIFCRIKKCFIEELDFDRSVYEMCLETNGNFKT